MTESDTCAHRDVEAHDEMSGWHCVRCGAVFVTLDLARRMVEDYAARREPPEPGLTQANWREAMAEAVATAKTAEAQRDQAWRNLDTAHDDIAAMLRASGLGDYARPISTHDVIQQELLPWIESAAARGEPPEPGLRTDSEIERLARSHFESRRHFFKPDDFKAQDVCLECGEDWDQDFVRVSMHFTDGDG